MSERRGVETARRGPGIGMPGALYLDEFGAIVRDAFGDLPFHVGSSLTRKRGWRDVDVRLILADEDYEAMGLGDPDHPHQNKKWVAMTKAFSALGQQLTSLPIDFQIQQRTHANGRYPAPHARAALGVHCSLRNQPSARSSSISETKPREQDGR